MYENYHTEAKRKTKLCKRFSIYLKPTRNKNLAKNANIFKILKILNFTIFCFCAQKKFAELGHPISNKIPSLPTVV